MTEQQVQDQEKQEGSNKIKSFIIGMVSFLIVTMSIFHFPFKRFSKNQIDHEAKYDPIIKSRNSAQDSLLNQLGKSLNIKEYKKAKKASWGYYQAKLKEFNVDYKKYQNEHKFLGRSNFKFWLFQFGIILGWFYFSVRSLIYDLGSEIKTGHEYMSMISVSLCLLYFYHLFFKTAVDFYDETYLIFEIIASVIAMMFVFRLVKYYSIKESKIKTLLELVFRIKRDHYRDMTVKALYAEKYGKSVDSIETVRNQSNKFDRDVKETVEKVIK